MASTMNPVERAIRDEFKGTANKGLRRRIREVASLGDPNMLQSVYHMRRTVGLTAWGQAGLDKIRAAQVKHENELYPVG